MDDLRDERSELDPRVDQLFASAMEQQLEEQRTLSRLASRVETALRDLQRGVESLNERATAGSNGYGADSEQSREALLQTLERLRLDAGHQRSEFRDGLERIADQLDLTGLRGEIAELAARMEQGAAPLGAAVDEMRGVLGNLVARGGPDEQLGDLRSWLTSFLEQVDARVADGHEEAKRAVVSAQRSLAEEVARLEALREALQAQSGHAGDRVAALLDHATANQREVLATLGSAAAHLASATSATREAAKEETEQLRACIAEAVAGARDGLDSSVGTARALCDQIAATGNDSRDVVDRMQLLLEELTARIDEAQALGARRISAATVVLEQTLGNLEPSVVAAVEDVRQALLDTAAAGMAQSESTVATLRGVAAGTVDELRGLVTDVAQRMLDAQAGATVELSQAAAHLVRAAEDMQPVFSSGIGKLYGAVAAAATQVRATSEAAAADTLTALSEVLQGIETTISDRLAESMVAAAEDRARTERAASAMSETLESLAPSVAAALARVDGTVNEAVTLVESALSERLAQSEAAAQVAAGDLQNAVSDAQDRLRVWLVGTLPDMAMQVTSGLSEQLERAEARVDTAATRMEALWDQAQGGLESVTEAASARMVEAARALTAIAGESVAPGERRLAALTQSIDVLIERLDAFEGSADAGGGLHGGAVDLSPRAERALEVVTERFEAVLAAVRGTGFTPPRHEPGYDATDRDTLALDLERTVERAEEIERRLSRSIEDVVHRLDEASTGLVRLESQMVGYLRERDRMLATERERLVADLAERLGPAVAARKDGGRLLGGLLPSANRRREPETQALPRPAAPRGAQQAVRPPGLPKRENTGSTNPGLPPVDNPLLVGEPARARRPGRGTQALPACEVCGFIAKSPGGLAAHRRTHE